MILPLVAAVTVLSVCSLAMEVAAAPALLAGTARVDITPPLEMKASLGGYGERMNRPAVGVHDRVWAKAIVLHQGDRKFALITADILAFPPGFKAAVIGATTASGVAWSPDQVILLASHSHTSIDMTALNPKNTFGIPQMGIFHPELYKRTISLFAGLITDANKSSVPCRVGTSSIQLPGWSHNRRHDNSAVQPELTVTRIDSSSGPVAALINWTAHPTFMDSDAMMYSGDYPGHMQRTVEALVGHGITAMYFNGAEGDQSPIARPDSGGDWEKAERYGRELGMQVFDLWKQIKTTGKATLDYHLEPIAMPERKWHIDFMRTGGAEYGLSEAAIKAVVEQLVPESSHSVSVRIGDLVIAGVPGELAATLGDLVKSRVSAALHLKHVVIGGLADEWTSYILDPAEYRKGGYEASMSFYGDGLGTVIVDSVARGASRLR